MMFSQASKYSIHAIMYIAERDSESVGRADIAGALGIPSNFLAKLLNRLATRGILISVRGPSGGYKLARPAGDIALIEVVEAVDGKLVLDDCAFGLPYCGRQTECELHARWTEIRTEILSMLQEKIPYAMASSPPELALSDSRERF